MTGTNLQMGRNRGLAKAPPGDSRSLPQQIEETKKATAANEIAEILAVSPITVYKPAKEGGLPNFRVGAAVTLVRGPGAGE
jgi:hypothetical protein